MPSSDDPAVSLLAGLNLEQQKKRARELLNAVRAGEPDALARFSRHHPQCAGRTAVSVRAGPWALHDAQLVVAREHGFPSWPRLKAELEGHAAARRTHLFVREIDFYEDRAEGLVSAHQAAVPSALAQIREWHPGFGGASDEAIRGAAFDLDAARLVYARQHGFRTWSELAARVAALAKGELDEPFMRAFEALRRADLPQLQALVRAHPELLRARGTNGNTLLNLAVSLAGSICGPLPPQADAMFDLLIGPGSDVDLANDRGWTPLHQAAYANRPELVMRLLGAGAAVDREAHGEGGTPLAVALFWGNREAADLLAARGIVPLNLRVAAGLGRADLIESLFGSDGALQPEAARGRGFYRPHSGFPVWQPSGERQEILDEALVWACKSGRLEVLDLLLARGARIDADPYRGTPLLWATSCGRLDTVGWLLDHGADVNRRATFGGLAHGDGVTALHLAAQQGDLPTTRLLCDCGADPTVEDRIYHSTPSGWAEHGGHTAVRDYLRSKAPDWAVDGADRSSA
ncbi:ankyrin repeat domain-containing protein [Longimicrobium sp.]|uniref:ankyrin repeat domain-containing protein n=1 Tax=Longimicrobium sp. TaxID=2029185 RepID=UPI002E2FC8B5|nr:ankyrin repeat domain-containing protein [Longimicrobium sp.]HEX6037752.1 ankyrin repeat domain-containing protein [Longimicrobium sp.]